MRDPWQWTTYLTMAFHLRNGSPALSEIEGNEPDEIPPSDPDSYVGLKEAENNGQWLQCIGKSVEKLPSYDG